MLKLLGNVIDFLDIIEEYGIDVFCFILVIGIIFG